jgi:hypothetical protein
MVNLIAGFVLGFFVATMGLSGVANALDGMIDKIKTTSISVDTK